MKRKASNPLLDSIEAEVDIPGAQSWVSCWTQTTGSERPLASVTDRLNRLRQEDHFDLPELPDQPEPSGTIIEGRLRIGIWLMPDNRSTGELEDFVGSMIPSGDPVWPLSEAYIDGIPE